MVQWFRPIVQNLGFKVSDATKNIYEEIQYHIDIIEANNTTSRVKNIDVYIYYVHEQYVY